MKEMVQSNLHMMKEMAKIHGRLTSSLGINLEAVMKAKTLREFDNHFAKFLKCTVD